MQRKISGKLLDTKEKEVSKFIEQQKRSGTTLKQIRFHTGLPEHTCKMLIRELEDKGEIIQRGIGNNAEFVNQKYTPHIFTRKQ